MRVSLLLLALAAVGPVAAQEIRTFAEILVTDAATGRGVPLVELTTVHRVRFVTDNAGRIALADPDLLGREVHFTVHGHGYEVPADGFGFHGVRVVPRIGEPVRIEVQRRNVAERLCRLTGEGRWRDSLLLGHAAPLPDTPAAGRIAGQDSIQAALYRGRVICLWGDTARLEYPLGLFRMAGATLPWPIEGDLAQGLAYEHFVDERTGFVRAMMPLAERPEGVVWLHALASVPDAEGRERLVCHYSRRASLEVELEQGLAVFDDERMIFTVARTLAADETWRKPSGHPLVVEEDGVRWLLYGSPSPTVRVPATYEAVLDPARYEAYTCADVPEANAGPRLDDAGAPIWRWQRDCPPTDSALEARWVREGRLDAARARFVPVNAADPRERVELHRGTVRWNAHRARYVLVACQVGGTSSYLGELWYAEADAPTGPFTTAVKVVSHDRMSFYNPCHHEFLDRDGGRVIHFEGTYTTSFSGNPEATPRYDYNQILYRLDLDHPALRATQVR
jgi:hypothetical protein